MPGLWVIRIITNINLHVEKIDVYSQVNVDFTISMCRFGLASEPVLAAIEGLEGVRYLSGMLYVKEWRQWKDYLQDICKQMLPKHLQNTLLSRLDQSRGSTPEVWVADNFTTSDDKRKREPDVTLDTSRYTSFLVGTSCWNLQTCSNAWFFLVLHASMIVKFLPPSHCSFKESPRYHSTTRAATRNLYLLPSNGEVFVYILIL